MLISHPPAGAFEGVSGRGIQWSQQRGRVFVAVSYTYLGGGMQPPGCRWLRGWFLIYAWCSGFLFVSSEWRAHVSKLEVRPFFPSGSYIVQCRRWCDVGLLTVLREHARMSPRWRYVHSFSYEICTMLCICCVMTNANKQAQWFGPKLSSVLAQSETAGERAVRNSAAWSRNTYVYWGHVYIWVSSSTRYLR